jgi:polar amino acid transport system ATP-binding protein
MDTSPVSASTGAPIIQIRHLRKSYYHGKLVALDDVSLDVPQGQVAVVIGPSGSGKSTMLRCLNYLEVPDSGEVIVDGISLRETKSLNEVRTEIGMVFQQFNLFPHLSVLENVMVAQRIVRKRSKLEAQDIAEELLVKVGIPEKASSAATRGHCASVGHAAQDHAL